MKLAKKVLVLVVALAMISTVAFSAFAASALSIGSAKTEEDGTVTVTAALSGAAGFQSGTFQLTWDPAVVEYVSQASDIAGAMVEGGKISDGAATVSVIFSNAYESDGLTLATFTFKAIGKAGDKSPLSLAVLDGDIDGIDEPAAATGEIEIIAKETEAPTTPAPTTEPTPAEPTTKGPDAPATTAAPKPTTPSKVIPKTGDAGIAVAAALVVLAGAAFVASKKSK